MDGKSHFTVDHDEIFLLILLFYFIYLFLERGEGREKERERNINAWCLLHAPYWGQGDLACNPGMFPDWESNQ